MPAVYVCPLSRVPSAVAEVRPSHLITLLDPKDVIPTPEGVHPDRHLKLGVNDVLDAHPNHIAPEPYHVERLIRFIEGWSGADPLLVHCWAGISRSSATAFIALCMNNPDASEAAIARAMRRTAPHIHPNRRIVAFADTILDRDGRMIEAIDALGPGRIVYEGVLFGVPLIFDQPPHA
jgi:predicted protein tyrosine phosphatase